MKAEKIQELTKALAELGYEIEKLEDGFYLGTGDFTDNYNSSLRLTLKPKKRDKDVMGNPKSIRKAPVS